MPFSFIYCSKWAWSYPLALCDLSVRNLPVVTGVSSAYSFLQREDYKTCVAYLNIKYFILKVSFTPTYFSELCQSHEACHHHALRAFSEFCNTGVGGGGGGQLSRVLALCLNLYNNDLTMNNVIQPQPQPSPLHLKHLFPGTHGETIAFHTSKVMVKKISRCHGVMRSEPTLVKELWRLDNLVYSSLRLKLQSGQWE